ncbi:MAG TPA: PHB depolymerase family esterase [Polyangiaceae bacterium]|nr:PHB depolymerase family esterase [Polyangiaceae bacterium]
MRAPRFTERLRAFRTGMLLVAFSGLLAACAGADDPEPGEGATPATASGGAAGGALETGGSTGSGDTGNGGDSPDGSGGAANGGAPTTGSGGSGAGAVGSAGGASTSSGGTVGAGSGGAASPGSGGMPAANVTCNPIGNGTTTLVANGVTRTFSVQMPADTSKMALLFLWHGWMQVPSDFANTIVYDVPKGKWVPFDPNAFPMPLMIVTPTDTKLIPPLGLDWDIVSGEKDFPFFEGMLNCIEQQYSIDTTRIYSFGFSAGAVFTDLLSAKYPHLFAATISESGAWFNDQSEWSDVSIPIIQWNWPAFDPADRGNVLLTHGGSGDYATVISLESTNTKALPYLHSNGRTVVECAHTFGHTLDPDLTQGMYYDYMWAHQLGGSPLAGPVPSFPTQAHPVGATSCTFHPYP